MVLVMNFLSMGDPKLVDETTVAINVYFMLLQDITSENSMRNNNA